jgi:hypothetical protein
MNDTALNSLEYCSFVLHKHRPQKVFTTEQLAHIADLIKDLEAEVEDNDDIDESLRDFLLQRALEMFLALGQLGVRGPDALVEALDQAVGATHRRIDLTVRMEDNKTAWAKFQDLVVAVGAALGIATSVLVLPGQVRQELEGPPPPQTAVVKIIEVPPHEPGLIVPKVQQSSEQMAQGHSG